MDLLLPFLVFCHISTLKMVAVHIKIDKINKSVNVQVFCELRWVSDSFFLESVGGDIPNMVISVFLMKVYLQL